MLKRIFTIALFTGAGQLFVIFALKYISQNSSAENVKTIGQIDSLVLFITNVIALGLQPAAMRNLALTDDWKQEYINTQSARLTLSILFCAFALLAFIDTYYLAFLIAPFLALSGDYALYGRGLPVKGAVIALMRAVLPFSIVMLLAGQYYHSLSWVYFLGLLTTYMLTDILIAIFLKVPSWPFAKITSLKLYLKTIPLGIVSLNLYFIGIGVILVAQYAYTTPVLATAFVGLKFYVIFKGVLRIIQQAFLKEMVKDEICLKIDQLSSLLGLTFLVSVLCFPETFISFFFGQKYIGDKNYFILLAAAGFIYSMFSSFTTRAMLDRKDNHYAIVTTIAALLTLLACLAFSFIKSTPVSIGLSILIGELLFAIGMLRLMKRKQLAAERFFFLLKNIPVAVIPFTAMFVPGDKKLIFFLALFIFIASIFLLNKNKFSFTESN
jgi:O-antigen/teichoic acid export membrane protein